MDGEDIRTRRPDALLCLIFNLTIGSCRERGWRIMDSNHLGRRGVMDCDLASCRKELMNTSRSKALLGVYFGGGFSTQLIEGLKKLYNREGKWQSSRASGGEKSSEAKRKSEKGQSHGWSPFDRPIWIREAHLAILSHPILRRAV
ncbi:hypothetical protein C4D60_Mb02t10100 [Musa balbisiana]|uniref:Uncharacterized protein n=1 Tax=Musa balbisiana TaxID=52838 RepID=A0A4S8IAG3_MUSBA|nr:hypothetical protein C4D60_Mb02t10100 [Musa balbisiana]